MRARRRGITVTAEIDRLAEIAGDGDRIGQALDNLLSNAIKYTPDGGSVAVRAAARGDVVVVEVADTGIGMAPADVERVFERFFRAESATERQIPGVGLGLSIVKAIVDGHGGHVEVDSVEGAGTTFRIVLPLAAPATRTARPREAAR